MLWLTLVGCFVAFWGFFGWFSEHHSSPLRWLALTFAFSNLIFLEHIAHQHQANLGDAVCSLLIGAIAVLLCYKK